MRKDPVYISFRSIITIFTHLVKTRKDQLDVFFTESVKTRKD